MVPVDAPRDNTLPIIRFAGHGLIVAALSTHLIFIAYKAATHPSPLAYRRSQRSLRNRSAIAFLVLAFLSLASVSAFAFRWRILSYRRWASLHGHKVPNGLWSGWSRWSGTINDAVGHWRLGDWLADVNLHRQADDVSILTPEGFLYTTQHVIGQLATSIFIGVEAHKRNLSKTVVSSLILLGSIGSLGFAQSLFFVIILYIPPIERHVDSSLHDALSTPHRELYYYPLASFAITLSFLPGASRKGSNLSLLRSVYLLAPFYFALLPKFVPISMRIQHSSIKNAYRSYAAVYRQLSVVSGALYTRAIFCSIYFNTPTDPSYIRDIFSNTISFPFNTKSIRFFSGTSTAHLNIAPLSKHPVISAISIDVMFTAISLLTWIFICDLDVEALLENCCLYHVFPEHAEQIALDGPDVQETVQQEGHGVSTDPNVGRALTPVAQEPVPVPPVPTTMETRTPGKRAHPPKRNASTSTPASKKTTDPVGNANATSSASGSSSSSTTARAMAPPPLPPRLRPHPPQPTVSALVAHSAAAAADAIPAVNPAVGAAANAAANAPAPSAAPPATPARRGGARGGAGGAPPTRRSARVRDYRAKKGLSRSVDSDADSGSSSDSDSSSESEIESESESDVHSNSRSDFGHSARNETDDLTYARAGDSMAFALFMMLSGGLGALGAAVLGAETMA